MTRPIPTVLQCFGASPRLESRSLTSTVVAPTTAKVAIQYLTEGVLRTIVSGIGTDRLPEWWGQPYEGAIDVGEGFEIRLQVFSGVGPNTGASSPVNTWIPMNGAAVIWEMELPINGSITGLWVIDIRSAATLQNLANCGLTITCNRS